MRVPHCPAACWPQAEQRIAKFSVVLTHRSDYHSQRFDPLLRGRTEQFGGWRDSPTPVESECHNVKTFLGLNHYSVG